MARIVGIDLPKDKKLEYALRYIYGIGPVNVAKVLADTAISGEIKVRELTQDQVNTLNDVISKEFKVEGDLRKDIHLDIRRLVSIGCYRGIRHKRGMPVRGQRTRTNARTRKGPRKASGIKKR